MGSREDRALQMLHFLQNDPEVIKVRKPKTNIFFTLRISLEYDDAPLLTCLLGSTLLRLSHTLTTKDLGSQLCNDIIMQVAKKWKKNIFFLLNYNTPLRQPTTS